MDIIQAGRLRGPHLAMLEKSKPGVPMEEALIRADGLRPVPGNDDTAGHNPFRTTTMARPVIVPNSRFTPILRNEYEWRGIVDAMPCWTGTMAAYDKPGKKLGKAIEYEDEWSGIKYLFPVPEEHQGKANAILLAEHPDFTLETDGRYRVVRAARVRIVEDFPVSSSAYTEPRQRFLADSKYDIPCGAHASDPSSPEARILFRAEKMVGLIAREFELAYDRRLISLCHPPSSRLGVIVEAI